jgi:hypothetical protein
MPAGSPPSRFTESGDRRLYHRSDIGRLRPLAVNLPAVVRVREPLRLKSTLVRVPCNMVPHYARIEDLGPGDYVSVFQCTACGPWRAVVSRKLRVRGPPLPPYSSWAKPEALDLVHVLPLSAVNRLFRRADLIVKFDPTPVNCRRQRVKSGSGSLLSSEPI